ncbi:MAG: hypothetical protein ABIR71_13970 [Chthoniobacterales bacterium]
MAGSSLVASNHSRQIFTVGAEAFTVRDIIDAAHFRGEVLPAWERFIRHVAGEERANEGEREADDASIDAAVQTFRYDHDLITAEETEAWLAERGLTLSDFSDYFTRHYWAEAVGDEVNAEPVDYFSASSDLRDLFLAELIFSGELGRMASRLSRRLAAAAASKEKLAMEEIAAQRQEFLGRIAPDSGMKWAASISRDEDWIEKMSLFEATFRNVCNDVLSPTARQREVGTLRLELTMFDLEILEVDSKDAAREALLCVRDDGMTMEEVATEGRYPFRRQQAVLEDIAPEMQQQFLSVTPGKVLEPMETDGAHRLCRVLAKREPNPEDPSVQRRVEQRLLDRYFADAVLQHVRWDLSLS